MPISRTRLVDTDVTRWYHCISRCVRRAMLPSEDGSPGRKDWIDNRLRELDRIFAIAVGGFSIKDNHLHLLLRIDVADVSEIRNGSVAATKVSDGFEHDLWLIPIEDRRKRGALRGGMREGFTVDFYGEFQVSI